MTYTFSVTTGAATAKDLAIIELIWAKVIEEYDEIDHKGITLTITGVA